jgi:mannose-6-phosphate isomerase
MQALEFEPILKRIRWGGRRLGELLNKRLGNHHDYAESWEIADLGENQSVVIDGPFRGWTLSRLIRERGSELLGSHAGLSRFPLLVKFLDARDRLSVQVHPDDEAAERFSHGASGKSEAWVIVHADPGSRLYAGLKHGIDRSKLETAIAGGNIAECLHSFPVAAGDCVHVPAGTVHAIGEGIVLAEIQQSSDLTFRLYDWGRVDADGRPRALHVAEALECIDFARGPIAPATPTLLRSDGTRVEDLVRDRYFVLRRHILGTAIDIPAVEHFRVLIILAGVGELCCGDERRRIARGTTLLLPASAPGSRIVPKGAGRQLVVLEAFVP